MEHIFDNVPFIFIKWRKDIVFNGFIVSRTPDADFDPLELRTTQMINDGLYAFMSSGTGTA